jgi:hypothetical protein
MMVYMGVVTPKVLLQNLKAGCTSEVNDSKLGTNVGLPFETLILFTLKIQRY